MRLALSLLFCLIISSFTKAQPPVANFNANVYSGCSPLTVTFTDQSTGNPKFWNWDFGNGQLSNQQNPVVVYSTPGVYTVTLVVKNSDGVDGITKFNYITVNPSPQASIRSSTTLACAPSVVDFFDNSTDSAGTIVAWKWTFSDGTTYNTQNVSKLFTTPGYYDVFLTITSSTGCIGGTGANRYLRVVSGLKVDFVNSEPQTCRPPFLVDFTNQTSGPGTLNYNWDFGNATTSTLTDPSTTYNTAGTYTIKLNAQSSLGCRDSIQKTITFAAKNTNFLAPDSTCLNSPVTFQNISSPSPLSTLWDFGDGTQATQANPSKAYSAPGIYTVKLFATYSNCTDSISKNIKVFGDPVVNFTANKTGTCALPTVTNFQDTSPDAVAWTWNFGDGSPTSNVKNPTHTYTANGTYDVTLTITDSKGCQNTLTKTGFIDISTPTVNITNLPTGGCGPNFTYTPVVQINSSDGVASYAWDFGDGFTSTAANPTHTYTALGSYTVTLTITTNGGCTVTKTYPGQLKVGSSVVVDFSKSAGVACNSSGVTFTNLSAPAGTGWIWDFGDGDTSQLQNPFHKYSDTGFYSVTLTVINNGCATSLTKNNFVLSSPPVAAFTDTVDCANRLQVKFTDKSKNNGPLTYLWKFGDPSIPNSTAQNNTITYPNILPKTYSVQLIVYGALCTDTVTKNITLFNEPASFAANRLNACQRDSIHVTSTNTNSLVKTYVWSVNGLNAGTNTAKFDTAFANFGSYNITLTVTDINGCISSITKTINIVGPKALFTVQNNGGCLNSPVVFQDASIPSGGIKRWTWNFGDGTIQNFSTPPFNHSYIDTGTYNIKLIVQDTVGCTDTLSKPLAVRVNRVKAFFSAERTTTCPDLSLQFTDSSYDKNSSYTYQWYFGDGGTSNLQNPVYQYAKKDTSYTVKLVVKDTVGCADSITRLNYIKVAYPKPAFDVKDSTTICPPLVTSFFSKAKDYESLAWDFGDGGTSVLLNPTHFYNDYGSFTVKLYTTGYGGCIDSASHVVNVYNPALQTKIGYPDTTVCNSILMNFDLKIPSSTRFYFFYGDGTLDSSQNLKPQHFYSIPSYYLPSIMLVDSQACQVTVNGPYKINVLGALPIFAKDRKAFCDSGTVFFTNFTIANDPIVSQLWDFGDGNTSNAKDAFNFYRQPGFYTPKLTVTTQAGCVNSSLDTIRVLATPHPLIGSSDTLCATTLVNFQGNLVTPDTAITWKWDFGDGQTSALQNPSVRYATPGNYLVRLEASNSLGCKDTVSVNKVVNPLPVITIAGDTSFIVGSGITIPLTYSPNVVSYNWTPPLNLSCTDCPNPFANPKFTTRYKVVVTDDKGCISSRDVTLIVLCNNKNFFIPNTFSPNGDGANDIFYPRGTGIDRIQALRIFNRWGEMVFEKRNFPSNDALSGWDGTYKGKPAGSDTYVYVIDIICENATIITYKGNVTLIR